MDPERIAQFRTQVASWREKGVAWAARVPPKAWVVLGLFFVAALLLALHTALNAKDSSLHLKVQHSYRSAQLSVWVDGKAVYSGHLTGYNKKKFGLIPDSVQGNLSRVIPISSGQHKLRVQVEPDDGSPQEEITAGDFPRRGERDLLVSARHSGLTLSWPASDEVAQPESASTPGWFSGYAGSLFLTIAGSIISALTGYAIRELPAQIRSRQSAAPKT